MKNQTKSKKAPEKKEHANGSKKKTAVTTSNKKHHTLREKEEKDAQPVRRGQNSLIIENTQPRDGNKEKITNEDHRILNEDGDYDFIDPTTLIMYLSNIRIARR